MRGLVASKVGLQAAATAEQANSLEKSDLRAADSALGLGGLGSCVYSLVYAKDRNHPLGDGCLGGHQAGHLSI